MGGSEQPVAGTTTQNTKSKSVSKTNMATTSDTTPTMPAWLEEDLKANVGNYSDALVDYKNMIDGWQAVPFTGDELTAFEMAKGAAGAGGPMQAAIDEMRRTAEGHYLYGGEGFNAAVDAAYRAGMPGVLSAFGAGGRSDGGLAKVALARAFSDPFAMQYGNERGRQLQAASQLPQMSLMPSSVWEQIGGKARELAQYGINTPFDLMKSYFGAMPGLTGMAAPFIGSSNKGTQKGKTVTNTTGTMTGTETPAYFPGNPMAAGIGGALSGAATGASIGSVIPGIGTGIGAGVGALAGGLGGFI